MTIIYTIQKSRWHCRHSVSVSFTRSPQIYASFCSFLYMLFNGTKYRIRFFGSRFSCACSRFHLPIVILWFWQDAVSWLRVSSKQLLNDEQESWSSSQGFSYWNLYHQLMINAHCITLVTTEMFPLSFVCCFNSNETKISELKAFIISRL